LYADYAKILNVDLILLFGLGFRLGFRLFRLGFRLFGFRLFGLGFKTPLHNIFKYSIGYQFKN